MNPRVAHTPVIIGRATHIYALVDEEGRTRYVGKTVRKLHRRLSQHKVQAKRERAHLPVCRWIRKHPGATIRLIETVPPGEDWVARERYWIEAHDNLLNLTRGGEGMAGHRFTQTHKDRIAAAMRSGAEFPCQQCGATFWRKRNQINKGQNKFCSRPCANVFNKGGHRG